LPSQAPGSLPSALGMANKDSEKNGKDMPAASAMETVFRTSLVSNEESLSNTPAFSQKASVVFEAFFTKQEMSFLYLMPFLHLSFLFWHFCISSWTKNYTCFLWGVSAAPDRPLFYFSSYLIFSSSSWSSECVCVVCVHSLMGCLLRSKACKRDSEIDEIKRDHNLPVECLYSTLLSHLHKTGWRLSDDLTLHRTGA